jgi:hypothetical protein
MGQQLTLFLFVNNSSNQPYHDILKAHCIFLPYPVYHFIQSKFGEPGNRSSSLEDYNEMDRAAKQFDLCRGSIQRK